MATRRVFIPLVEGCDQVKLDFVFGLVGCRRYWREGDFWEVWKKER